MALTDSEKYKVVSYLGYPVTVLVSGNVNYDKIVVDRLAAVPAGAECILSDLLERLDKTGEQLTKALCRMGTKKIDDIELRDNEADILRKEKYNLIRELGMLVDITPVVSSGMNIKVCV